MYCCPKCKHKLENKESRYTCKSCGIDYWQYAGIPNFKPYELYDGERKILKQVEKVYPKLTFSKLVEYMDNIQNKNVLPWELRRYLRFAEMDEDEQQKWLENYAQNTIIKIGKIQLEITRQLLDKIQHKITNGRCLEIGCGRGPWAVAAAPSFDDTYALDLDMASLLIAQKFCEENHILNIHFLSATSSALPFQHEYFDLINSQAVLEHVDDQSATLEEINRVLCTGGCFTGDSVNRYNIFTPEPHINLRLVSFLPKNMAHKISLRLKKLPYKDIKPLSYHELQLKLQQVFVNQFKIIPFAETSEHSLTYNIMKHLPTAFLNIFTNTHYIAVCKNNRYKN